MSDILINDLKRQNRTLLARLTVRACQYNLALEGLQNIVDSNDPMGIAQKTIEAMEECVPGKDS